MIKETLDCQMGDGFLHALRDAMRLRRFHTVASDGFHTRLRRDFFVVGVGALDDPF